MNHPPPISFKALAKLGGSPKSGGAPYQIRGDDLDKNFVFATLQVDGSLIKTEVGPGGHIFRKLDIPKRPNQGTFLLGSVEGTLQWIATEEC